MVTENGCAPRVAVEEIVTFAVIMVSAFTVVVFTVIPVPAFTDEAPVMNPAPLNTTSSVCVWLPRAGDRLYKLGVGLIVPIWKSPNAAILDTDS